MIDVDRTPTGGTSPWGALSFDSKGRLTGVGTTTYSYDADGNLTGISSADGSLSIGHAGPVPTSVTWNGPVTGTVSIGRNALFQATSYSVVGQEITRDVDGDGVVSRVGALTIDRSDAGFVQGTTLGGPVTGGGVSVTDTVTPNELGEPLHYVASLQSGDGSPATGVEDVTYTRDAGGRITTVSETIANPLNPTTPDTRSARYTYDELGRLACVYHDGQLVAHHVYDDNGNRIGASSTCNGDTTPAGVTGASVVEAASIGPSNRLDAATVRDVFGIEHRYTYGYDGAGALATKTEAPDAQHPSPVVTSYTYDAYGNLRHVELPDGRQIDYLIDAANRRVGKLVNGVRVQGFLYQDALRPIAELDANNGVTGIFVYGSKGNVPDYIERGDTRYRLISDNVGSVRLVINTTTGAIEQRLDYDEYGNVIQDTNPGFQPFGFAGGLYDPDTKLVRFGARDYDAETGRWTAKDPIGFGGGAATVYGYVANDPVNSADPDGRILPLLIGGALVGGAVSSAVYAIVSWQQGSEITKEGLIGTFLGGAIAGEIGVMAAPLAAAAGLGCGVAGTAVVNAAGGVLGALVNTMIDPHQKLTASYVAWSGVFAGFGGAAAARSFATRGMSVFEQVGFPRTWRGVVPRVLGGKAGPNTMNAIYKGTTVAATVGATGPYYVQEASH